MSSPAHSVQEFIAYAKANPGKATYASSGHGTSVHLSGELFNAHGRHRSCCTCPIAAPAPALNDLIPGRVDVMFNNIGAVLPLIQGGKLRALGVTSSKRARGAAGRADRRPKRACRASTCRPGTRCSCRPGRRPPIIAEAARRHRAGARRSGDQGAARAARRRRDRLVAGGTSRAISRPRWTSGAPSSRRPESRSNDANSGAPRRRNGLLDRPKPSLYNPPPAPQCPGSSVGRACD